MSDEEEIADPEVDNTVRGKGGRKTGGRQTGTADAVASAAKLQQASLPSNTATLCTLAASGCHFEMACKNAVQ